MRSYGLCFCQPFFETNNFLLPAVLPPRLVSELQNLRLLHLNSVPFLFFILLKSLSGFKAEECQVWGRLVYPSSSYKRKYIKSHFQFYILLAFLPEMFSIGPICIAEYRRNKLYLNPVSSPGTEPRTVFGFVTSVLVISSPEGTKVALSPFLCSA